MARSSRSKYNISLCVFFTICIQEGRERNDGIHIVKKAQREMMEYI